MGVTRVRSSTMRLSWFGSRCWTSTKAMPLFAGIALKNFLNASSPPAEAPSPTTVHSGAARRSSLPGGFDVFGREREGVFREGSEWPVAEPLRGVFLAIVASQVGL